VKNSIDVTRKSYKQMLVKSVDDLEGSDGNQYKNFYSYSREYVNMWMEV
jgi:hypothetical protein